MSPLFSLGRVVATPNALAALKRNGQAVDPFLERHQQGDWGNLSEEDVVENIYSLTHGLRLLSSYRLNDRTPLWIITEADRSVTTILLPEDY